MLWLGQVENADFMAELSGWKFPAGMADPETAAFPVKEADNPAVTNVEQLSSSKARRLRGLQTLLPSTGQKLQQQPLLAVLKMPGKPPPRQ